MNDTDSSNFPQHVDNANVSVNDKNLCEMFIVQKILQFVVDCTFQILAFLSV